MSTPVPVDKKTTSVSFLDRRRMDVVPAKRSVSFLGDVANERVASTERRMPQSDSFIGDPENQKLVSRRGSLANRLVESHRSHRTGYKKSFRRSAISLSSHGAASFDLGYEFRWLNLSKQQLFYLVWVILPSLFSIWYATAVLFPPGCRSKWKFLLWTNGSLIKNDQGQPTLCPRPSICSEGVFQIILISLARLSAFASYTVMGMTFVSRMHSSIYFLSNTYAAHYIPFEYLHKIHNKMGAWYAGLAVLHTITHLVRYAVRQEMTEQMKTTTALSGVVAIISMIAVTWSMTHAKRFKSIEFERRLQWHWYFLVLTAACCVHHPRTRRITLLFVGMWLLDYLYDTIFRTYRLDVVEFTPLPDLRGVQMLWRNPKGFHTKSGEYVKMMIPWLAEGGHQWHPFSVYLRDATQEGIEVLDAKEERGSFFLGNQSTGDIPVIPSKTALLAIEFQNEVCKPGGKLYESVREVMVSNSMQRKAADLMQLARSVGAHVFHAPFIYDDDSSPNPKFGIMNWMRRKQLYRKGSWGAEFNDLHKPWAQDYVVENRCGLDAFAGTNLENLVHANNIETLIIFGFQTNCSVESTIRSAYEKGINVIALTDVTACESMEEQKYATEKSWRRFCTPLSYSDARNVLKGEKPPEIPSNLYRVEEMDEDLEENATMPHEMDELENYIQSVLLDSDHIFEESYHVMSARQDLNEQYDTTQIFIAPSGDWCKQLATDIVSNKRSRHCYVSGPYTSPYSTASNFSHLLLTASGVGITPAIATMNQYPADTRTKVLVWTVRCPKMLKFFAPLLKDAHLVVIFYTGKKKLSATEVGRIQKYGNIFLQQSRPENLTDTLKLIIVQFESILGLDSLGIQSFRRNQKIENIDPDSRAAWCIFYCGGSKVIRDILKAFARKAGTGWQCELFDW